MERVTKKQTKFVYRHRPAGMWINRLSRERQFAEVAKMVRPIVQKGPWPSWAVRLFGHKHSLNPAYLEWVLGKIGATEYQSKDLGEFWDLRDLRAVNRMKDPTWRLDHGVQIAPEEVQVRSAPRGGRQAR